eukprot:350032-Chlamydomonas_euryale.AAC.4
MWRGACVVGAQQLWWGAAWSGCGAATAAAMGCRAAAAAAAVVAASFIQMGRVRGDSSPLNVL